MRNISMRLQLKKQTSQFLAHSQLCLIIGPIHTMVETSIRIGVTELGAADPDHAPRHP